MTETERPTAFQTLVSLISAGDADRAKVCAEKMAGQPDTNFSAANFLEMAWFVANYRRANP